MDKQSEGDLQTIHETDYQKMRYTKQLIDRYKHSRSTSLLRHNYLGKYAFVGIGNHSMNNLYPVLAFLHVPLKYICCKSANKLPLIGNAYPGVHATTSLQEILADKDVKGVFVSAAPQAHFAIATEVLKSGKALFIEKPPCQSLEELARLMDLQKEHDTIVEVGLQKRNSPIMRILQKELKKSKGAVCYNLKYLTGAYPEGDALLDLFIHPLDCMTYLFGEGQVKSAVNVENHTLMLILEHHCATGILELSTGYSWSDAKEHWTINTDRGVYEMDQFDNLTLRHKSRILMGIPMEKVFPCGKTTVSLFERNNFIPLQENNQIVSQGYYDTIKGFVDAVEGKKTCALSSLEHLTHTYSLIENIRTLI